MRDESCEPTDADVEFVLRVAQITVRRMGASTYEADEVAQCTAVKLWSRWETANVTRARTGGEARWIAYVRTTAQRTHYDLIRGHRRREDRHNRAAGGRVEARVERPGCLSSTPDDTSGIDDWLARQQVAEQIDRLPARQATVAALSLLAELTVNEISEMLDVQPQSVRKQLRLAKENLRALLSESELESL